MLNTFFTGTHELNKCASTQATNFVESFTNFFNVTWVSICQKFSSSTSKGFPICKFGIFLRSSEVDGTTSNKSYMCAQPTRGLEKQATHA